MKKRMLMVIAVVFILAEIIGVPAVAAEGILESGKFGENVTWTMYDNGTLVFSGSGETADGNDYIVQDWYRYNSQLEHVVFEEGITYIGEYILHGSSSMFQNIKSITIPSSVTEIGKYAFSNLAGLESLYISDLEKWCGIRFNNGSNVLSQKVDLYLNGTLVESLVIPETVSVIGDYTFMGCTSIKYVEVHANVTQVGSFAFNTCTNLQTITFLGKAPSFGKAVFSLTTPTAFYPGTDSSWDNVIGQDLGGTVTWVKLTCGENHVEKAVAGIDPSCTSPGLTEGTICAVCGVVLKAREEIPVSEHKYESVVIAPSCTGPGYTTYTCTMCGDSFSSDYVDPPGHTFGEWQIVEEPDYGKQGRRERMCVVCETIEGDFIAPLETEPPATEPPATEPMTTESTEPESLSTEPSVSDTQPSEQETQPAETEPSGSEQTTPSQAESTGYPETIVPETQEPLQPGADEEKPELVAPVILLSVLVAALACAVFLILKRRKTS